MRTLISILFFCFFSHLSFGQQKTTEEQNVYNYLFKNIQNSWLRPGLDTNNINFISDNIFRFPYAEYKRISKDSFAIIDSVALSDFEKNYIKSCIKNLTNQHFTKADRDNYGLKNFKLLGVDKDTRKKQSISLTYSIMKPIFIRDKTVCIIYYNYGECGGLCGEMELSVLKKVTGEWRHLITLFHSFD